VTPGSQPRTRLTVSHTVPCEPQLTQQVDHSRVCDESVPPAEVRDRRVVAVSALALAGRKRVVERLARLVLRVRPISGCDDIYNGLDVFRMSRLTIAF
jgi:hypothetical protein